MSIEKKARNRDADLRAQYPVFIPRNEYGELTEWEGPVPPGWLRGLLWFCGSLVLVLVLITLYRDADGQESIVATRHRYELQREYERGYHDALRDARGAACPGVY